MTLRALGPGGKLGNPERLAGVKGKSPILAQREAIETSTEATENIGYKFPIIGKSLDFFLEICISLVFLQNVRCAPTGAIEGMLK